MMIERRLDEDEEGENIWAVVVAVATVSRATLQRPRNSTPRVLGYRRAALGGAVGDEAGHLVAWCLGGPNDPRNIIPQNKRMNRHLHGNYSAWRGHEDEIRDLLKYDPDPGITVSMEFVLRYDITAPGLEVNRPQDIFARYAFYSGAGLPRYYGLRSGGYFFNIHPTDDDGTCCLFSEFSDTTGGSSAADSAWSVPRPLSVNYIPVFHPCPSSSSGSSYAKPPPV